jgi:hypothetical protein
MCGGVGHVLPGDDRGQCLRCAVQLLFSAACPRVEAPCNWRGTGCGSWSGVLFPRRSSGPTKAHLLNYIRSMLPRPRGAEGRRKKKMKATYIWQMINQVGRYLLFF